MQNLSSHSSVEMTGCDVTTRAMSLANRVFVRTLSKRFGHDVTIRVISFGKHVIVSQPCSALNPKWFAHDITTRVMFFDKHLI